MITLFDIATFFVVGYFAIQGMVRGVLEEGDRSMGWAVALVMSAHTFAPIVAYGQDVFPVVFSHQAASIVVFIAMYIVFRILMRLLVYILSLLPIKALDRILGLLFGFCKGLFLAGAIMFCLDMISLSDQDVISTSLSYHQYAHFLVRFDELYDKGQEIQAALGKVSLEKTTQLIKDLSGS